MKETHQVHCDCNAIKISMEGKPKVHAYCHCDDCRELLQVPYHSVLAWESDKVSLVKGSESLIEYQHPKKKMKRMFCKDCGEVIYNTNAMGWKLVSQLLFKKCHENALPDGYESNAHFFYKE